MDVRKLEAKDFFTIAQLLGKIGRETFSGVDYEKVTEGQLGLLVVTACLEYAETDFKNFFASLTNTNPEEFDHLPFDAPIVVIEKLMEQEDMNQVFLRLKGLAKKSFSGNSTSSKPDMGGQMK